MKLDDATNLDRKSGGPQWRDLQYPFPSSHAGGYGLNRLLRAAKTKTPTP
jgi:hypothetical protein